jgi:polyferredoxin
MDKMSYPRGLISYTSEHQLQGGKTKWLRPRMIGYVLVLCVMVGLFSYRVTTRVPLELTVIRDRNELYLTTMEGKIENIYTLSLVNMEQSMHEFEILISGIEGAEIIGETLYTLDGGEVRSISLRVSASPEQLPRPSSDIVFTARATDQESLEIHSESRFMRPL